MNWEHLLDYLDCMFGDGSAEAIETMGISMWSYLCNLSSSNPVRPT